MKFALQQILQNLQCHELILFIRPFQFEVDSFNQMSTSELLNTFVLRSSFPA